MKLPRQPGSSADRAKTQPLCLASQAGVFTQRRGSGNVSSEDGFSSSYGLKTVCFPPGLS